MCRRSGSQNHRREGGTRLSSGTAETTRSGRNQNSHLARAAPSTRCGSCCRARATRQAGDTDLKKWRKVTVAKTSRMEGGCSCLRALMNFGSCGRRAIYLADGLATTTIGSNTSETAYSQSRAAPTSTGWLTSGTGDDYQGRSHPRSPSRWGPTRAATCSWTIAPSRGEKSTSGGTSTAQDRDWTNCSRSLTVIAGWTSRWTSSRAGVGLTPNRSGCSLPGRPGRA